jgi:hypothetical protein
VEVEPDVAVGWLRVVGLPPGLAVVLLPEAGVLEPCPFPPPVLLLLAPAPFELLVPPLPPETMLLLLPPLPPPLLLPLLPPLVLLPLLPLLVLLPLLPLLLLAPLLPLAPLLLLLPPIPLLLEPPPFPAPLLLPPLPGPTLIVTPSVVMGLVIVAGSVTGVELMSIPLGPTTMVSEPMVMVEAPVPISMVDPPTTMSVTVCVVLALEGPPPDPPECDCEPLEPPGPPLVVVAAGGGSFSVMVWPSVVMTVLPPLEPNEMVLDPTCTPPGPMTKVSLFTVTVEGVLPIEKVLLPITIWVGLVGGAVAEDGPELPPPVPDKSEVVLVGDLEHVPEGVLMGGPCPGGTCTRVPDWHLANSQTISKSTVVVLHNLRIL